MTPVFPFQRRNTELDKTLNQSACQPSFILFPSPIINTTFFIGHNFAQYTHKNNQIIVHQPIDRADIVAYYYEKNCLVTLITL